MIFANHAHIYPKEIRPSGSIDSLKKLMENCSIDKCVAFATFPDRFKDSGLDMNQNQWLADKIKTDSSLVGFGTIDFENKDLKGQVDEISDCGFKGIKLHPQAQEFKVDSEEAFEIYSRAEELGLFITFHTGVHWHRLRDNNVLLFDEVAYNFKNLRFSMEHIGGFSFFKEALAVMVNNKRDGRQPRIFAGWTSIFGNDKDAWSLTDEQLETLLFQTSDNNSIFGLDFPFKDEQYISNSIQRIQSMNLSKLTKEKILGDNLERELFGSL